MDVDVGADPKISLIPSDGVANLMVGVGRYWFLRISLIGKVQVSNLDAEVAG